MTHYEIIRANEGTVDAALESLEREVREALTTTRAMSHGAHANGAPFVVTLADGTYTAMQAVVW